MREDLRSGTYQDTHGRVLDLCLSKALSSRVPVTPGMCSLLPEPGVFDDTQDIVFPGNFPSEASWFTADALIQEPATVTASAIGNGTPVTINVLANDNDPEGNTPLTIVNLTQPAASQGSVSSNGSTLTYTPPSGVTANFSTTFTYQARDSLGTISNVASVSVSVTPLPLQETLALTSATVSQRPNGWNWAITSTTSVVNGNSITVLVDGVVLGTAAPNPNGRWQIRVNNSSVAPPASRTVTVKSSLTSQVIPVTVQ